MSSFNHKKYVRPPVFTLPDRTWPDAAIDKAPIWASVDLRDGNQALINPMSPAQKMRFFDLLVNMGFKQIEVGFPGASATDYDFIRQLIALNKIPEDVTIQVLTQAREHIIEMTFSAVKGARQVIVHLYNSTSKVQREQVFALDKAGIVEIAVRGADKLLQCAKKQQDTLWIFEYSPESYSATENDFAVEISNAVLNTWLGKTTQKPIVNLPATVEMTTPNVYADQIEWFCRHINHREQVTISVHTHNDRGCAVAAAELAVMAGADRVEGSVLGNGERTGNMDILTMAMNLYSQGIDPKLNLENMEEIIRCVVDCTEIPVHPRHPYAGELVYTAFSGSHQDAINKCLKNQKNSPVWNVAYLPIDPGDLGRKYEQIIRVNSQSGKAGASFILANEYDLHLPKWLAEDFSPHVQATCDRTGQEITPKQIYKLFKARYMDSASVFDDMRYHFNENRICVEVPSLDLKLEGRGAGPIDATVRAICVKNKADFAVQDYQEHALAQGNNAQAVAYVLLKSPHGNVPGVGIGEDITKAALIAVLSAARFK